MGLQEERIEPSLPVNVSIRNVKKTFSILFAGEKKQVTANVTITVSINGIRGAHISRLVEALRSASSEDTLENIGKKIINYLENNHPVSKYICVRIEFTTTIAYHSAITDSLEELPINVVFSMEKKENIQKYHYEFTLSTMTACPNMIALNGKLTHTQRGLTNIIVETKQPINFEKLIKNCLSIVFPTHPLLKISHEKKLVKAVCESPAFSEDIIRKVAYEIAKLPLPDDTIIQVRHTSQESIHPFDIVAEGCWYLKEIREKIKKR